ncbi:hypothetical protein [Nostoc sp.]
MTNKELLIQEIETLPPELLTEVLGLIRSIKVNYTKKELERGKLEPIPLSDSTETSSDFTRFPKLLNTMPKFIHKQKSLF